LHPKLVAYLVSMFHNPEINKHGAQLIFVTHETSLLNQDTFRKDQVWCLISSISILTVLNFKSLINPSK
jgi:predicted ATPase